MISTIISDIAQADEYIKEIFALRNNLIDKDFRIAVLELELAVEKDLTKTLKKYYLPQEV